MYGDLPSLVECILSLKLTIDQSVDRVLLVNDVGPDADAIEARVLELIEGEPAFFYERNPRNLGFVGACNRAALELDRTNNDILLLNSDTVTTPGFLDELSSVLHSSPKNGAVCPRSNNATIASLPFKLRDPSVGRAAARSATVHSAVKELLPPFSIAPVAMGFCILLRRELIVEFGLFDEIFSPGYGEENDFCLRVGERGFRSVIAHRAIVFHAVGRSFVGPRRDALRAAHEKILVTRYPAYPHAVREYIYRGRDAVDVFADALVPGDSVIRILIDIDWSAGESLTAWQVRLLRAVSSAVQTNRACVTVAVPDSAASRIGRQFPALKVAAQSRVDGLWDVALGFSTFRSQRQLARMNRVGLRWVLEANPEATADRFADHIIDTAVTSPVDVLPLLLDRWGRSVVDIATLRERWKTLTANPDYSGGATTPREARGIGFLRRLERIAPHPIGLAKGLARLVLRRGKTSEIRGYPERVEPPTV